MKMSTLYVVMYIKDEILYARYKDGLHVDLMAAKSIVESRLEFQGGTKRKLIMYVDGVSSMSADARRYLTGPEGVKGIIAAAVIKDSKYAEVIAYIVSRISKPTSMPVRSFRKEENALKWLATVKVTEVG